MARKARIRTGTGNSGRTSASLMVINPSTSVKNCDKLPPRLRAEIKLLGLNIAVGKRTLKYVDKTQAGFLGEEYVCRMFRNFDLNESYEFYRPEFGEEAARLITGRDGLL